MNCRACGRPTVRLVYVITDGSGDHGPYGRECARQVVDGFTKLGVTATRRYARAERDPES